MHMNLTDVAWAAAQALHLLGAAPLAWLLLVLAYLGVVESLMFVPRVGFIVKLWLAAVGQAPVLVMAAAVAAGQPVALAPLAQALMQPLASQAVLALGPLLAFGVGLVLLRHRAGPGALRFFFGNIVRDKPPPAQHFLAFKIAMHAVSLPFVFVPAAVVLAGQGGLDGLRLGLALAWAHPWALGALGLAGVMFERLVMRLPRWLPKPWGALATGVVLVGFLGFSFAWLYALSALAVAR